MREHFRNELDELKSMLKRMAEQTDHAVLHAIMSVASYDEKKNAAVINGDAEIDRLELKIEEECLKLMALYQPVASDLRTVITVLKINNELERAADLAVSIAERAEDMAKYNACAIEKFDFSIMVDLVLKMLQDAIDSMLESNSMLAMETIKADDNVDNIHRGNYELVKNNILAHEAQAGYYLDCLTVSRSLERIADIATNIAEDVIYLEQGRIVRHMSKLQKE